MDCDRWPGPRPGRTRGGFGALALSTDPDRVRTMVLIFCMSDFVRLTPPAPGPAPGGARPARGPERGIGGLSAPGEGSSLPYDEVRWPSPRRRPGERAGRADGSAELADSGEKASSDTTSRQRDDTRRHKVTHSQQGPRQETLPSLRRARLRVVSLTTNQTTRRTSHARLSVPQAAFNALRFASL